MEKNNFLAISRGPGASGFPNSGSCVCQGQAVLWMAAEARGLLGASLRALFRLSIYDSIGSREVARSDMSSCDFRSSTGI